MIQWDAEGFVLSARPHGETAALVELFTAGHGRIAGFVHGGASRRLKPSLQIGNRLHVAWSARVSEQLGKFASVELVDALAARALGDAAALAALTSAAALIRGACAERQAYPGLFETLEILAGALETEFWPPLYTRFEVGLLGALGYGLDLSACALTGETADLAYVSPKTGRAASREAGAPFADKLLALPPFLTDPEAPLAEGDVADAFALAGYFLERRVFDPMGEGLPDARRRLIETLGRQGRL